MPEIMRSSNLKGVFVPNIEAISIVWRKAPQKVGKLRNHTEYAHRLGPAVAEGAFRGHHKFVAEPPVEDVAEEEHAAVHVKATVMVDDLLAHRVGHRGALGEPTDVLNSVEVLQDIVSEGEVFPGDVFFGPQSPFVVRVQFFVHVHDLFFDRRHFSVYPNEMDLFRDNVRLFSGGVGLIF